MGVKRGDSAKCTCNLTSLFSMVAKRARVGQLQQLPIAIDSDLEKEASGVDDDPGRSTSAPAELVAH
jgi:hypothetical protein